MMTFQYAWFFAGLAFLAVPVLLHLMNRDVPRRLVFPSIRFIRRARLPREGRRQLRDILLLLLRLLAIAAAVFAFARPLWRRPPADTMATQEAEGSTVVILDASASMSKGTSWDRAVQLARTALQDASGPAGLIISAQGVEDMLPPGSSGSALETALAAAAPRPVAGAHGEALAEAARLVSGTGSGIVVIVSDLQLGDWQDARSVLPASTDLRLLSPEPSPAHNVGITQVTATHLAPGQSRVVVQARSYSDVAQQRTVTVRIGSAAKSRTVSLPPLQVRSVAFALDHGPDAQGVAQLTSDDYAYDDSYVFWAGPHPPLPAVAVSPEPDSDQDPSDQLFFLRKSLETSSPGQVRFRLQTVPADAFFAVDLSNVSTVFFLGAIESLEEAGFERLRDFLAQGGTAVCTPGRMPSHMFHSLHVNDLFVGRFLEVLGSRRRRGETYGIGWINPDSVLAQVFREPDATDLFLFPIRRYVRFEAPDSAMVHLKTLQDDPVLAEQSVQRGRVFVSAIPFDTEWSDFPLSASFLPVIREIAQAGMPPDQGIYRIACGEALPLAADLLGNTPDLPANSDTAKPRVMIVGETPVEINVDRRESSPQTINTFDLSQQLTGAVAAAPQLRAVDPAVTVALWPWFASLAALLLLVERLYTVWSDTREIRGRMSAT